MGVKDDFNIALLRGRNVRMDIYFLRAREMKKHIQMNVFTSTPFYLASHRARFDFLVGVRLLYLTSLHTGSTIGCSICLQSTISIFSTTDTFEG